MVEKESNESYNLRRYDEPFISILAFDNKYRMKSDSKIVDKEIKLTKNEKFDRLKRKRTAFKKGNSQFLTIKEEDAMSPL